MSADPVQSEEQPRVLSVASSYSDQPESKIITISRIGDAQNCARKYYKNYVEEPRQTPPFETIEAGVGSYFHSYVEAHFKRLKGLNRAIDAGDVIDLDDLLRNFRMSFVWEGRLRDPYRIVRAGQSLREFEERLKVVGERFNEFLCRDLAGHSITGAEGQLQIRTAQCYIRGKYDLITESPSGILVLWDWKTGKMPDPKYYSEYSNMKAQLGVYAVWMRYRFEAGDVRGTTVYFRDGILRQSETFTPAVERDVLDYMLKWRETLNAMTTYPATSGQLCPWCCWKEGCDMGITARPRAEPLQAHPRPEPLQTHPRPELLQTSGPASVVPDRKSGPCFVATAVFDGEHCHEVDVLRRFRDEKLKLCAIGRLFTKCYDACGPYPARYLSTKPGLKYAAKRILRIVVRALRDY